MTLSRKTEILTADESTSYSHRLT